MGEGMPYHLEKGPLLRIIERNLNADRPTMQAMLGTLQAAIATNSESMDWLDAATALWSDPGFNKPLSPPGAQMRERIITEWFGYESNGSGGWRRPPVPPPTTGYWIGYRGDVHAIVRRAFAWAIELALGTGAKEHAQPWPIELFWKCPAPWFEAWVVSRPAAGGTSGLVTVVLVSPSHRAAVVADSPIAHSDTASPSWAQHPVPSWEDDYEWLGQVTHPVADRPRVKPATDRDFAMWVVSQREHVRFGNVPRSEQARQEDTRVGAPFSQWWIPQLAMYEGRGDVVVVAPSMAAGGVKHDGTV
jgi:hypothetical protein